MNKYYALFVIAISVFHVEGQSIRKNFTEMSEYEKIEFVNGFYALRSNGDLINDLATFHNDFFNFDNTSDSLELDIHFNLPDEPERDVFLAWHRQQMFEVEQALQNVNPRISMVYWDSSVETSVNSTLWDQDLLGSFDANWSLERDLGADGPLPTPTQVNTIQNIPGTSWPPPNSQSQGFYAYSNRFERGRPHSGAHYLHHTYVDKLWMEWEEDNPGSSGFISTSLLRYDGTYVFNGQTLPSVNPNSIVDSRVLGVFYAENGLAVLDNYIVSNTYNPEEVFYYQFLIEAGDDGFIVPSGRVARIESLNTIELKPGFMAASGSTFTARIDVGNSGLTGKSNGALVVNDKPFDHLDIKNIVEWQEDNKDNSPVFMTTFPNPFVNKITINLNKKTDCSIKVFNMMGMLIRTESFQNTDTLEINDLYGLASGIYVIQVVNGQGEILLAKRVVKL